MAVLGRLQRSRQEESVSEFRTTEGMRAGPSGILQFGLWSFWLVP